MKTTAAATSAGMEKAYQYSVAEHENDDDAAADDAVAAGLDEEESLGASREGGCAMSLFEDEREGPPEPLFDYPFD